MNARIPYMLSPGLIPKILEKVQQARRPDRFTQDFLETKLGHGGGSARPIIPLLKRMGFIASDGVPTSRYDEFRNPESQAQAIAAGMREAFSEIFDRNTYAYELPRDKLTALVVQITGSAKEDRTSQAIVSTFWTLKEMADFEGALDSPKRAVSSQPTSPVELPPSPTVQAGKPVQENVDFRLSYTINLNLPETTDPEVFNAIFKALKEHLLRDS